MNIFDIRMLAIISLDSLNFNRIVNKLVCKNGSAFSRVIAKRFTLTMKNIPYVEKCVICFDQRFSPRFEATKIQNFYFRKVQGNRLTIHHSVSFSYTLS